MNTLLAFCIACATVGLAGSATAQSLCRLRDLGMPHVTQNRDGAWQVLLDPGQTSCQATFAAGGRSDYQTTSAAVVSPARAGTVRLSTNGFVYSSRPGFTGGDSFTLRTCGKNRVENGCANVTYHISQ
jgi:hypothetical protein